MRIAHQPFYHIYKYDFGYARWPTWVVDEQDDYKEKLVWLCKYQIKRIKRIKGSAQTYSFASKI